MHRKLFAFVFVAALLSSAVVVFANSDSSDAVTPTVVKGFVGMPGDPNIPAAGMKIYLTDSGETAGKSIEEEIGSDGSFTFNLAGTALEGETVLHIIFGDVNYRAQNLPLHVSRIADSNHLKLDLSEVDGSECILGSNMDQAILLVLGKGDLEFTVKGTNRFLVNAMIILEDTESTEEFSGETENGGKYKFVDLPYGKYSVKVTCNGYVTQTENLDYIGQATHSVTMIEKEIPTFYGMTTYHALMMLGVAVGLILVLISYIMVRRNSKGIED